MNVPPLHCRYDGDNFVPLRPKTANKHFVVGEVYPFIVHEDRSAASHKQYFASLHEAWTQLPEWIGDLYPTPEHLRKRALIEAGYYDEEIIDCGSNKVAPSVSAAIRKRDDFALIQVRDHLVIIHTAKSQSMRAMGKKDFQASKAKVLEIVWGLCGHDAREAAKHVGQAA